MDVVKDLDCESVEEGDLVSRYVTHRLSEEDAEAFEKHYLGCDRCWTEVQRATEIRAALAGTGAAQKPSPEPAARVVRGPWTNWRLLAAAAAVGLVALGGMLFQRGRSSDPIVALAAAVGPELPIEARLTGKFSNRRPPAGLRGDLGRTTPRGLRNAADKTVLEAEGHPTSRNVHAAGLAHLLLGEFDEAIQKLREASEKNRDPLVLSDLSAAYWARGRTRHSQADFQSAFESAEEALARNPKTEEALFNRSLAVEQLAPFAPEKIKAAWTAYLGVDSASPWADIARKHIEAVRREISAPRSDLWPEKKKVLEEAASSGDAPSIESVVSEFSQQSRVYVEEELLPEWAEVAARGVKADAARFLTIARHTSRALLRVTGNTLPEESVQAIWDALESDSSPRIQLLIEGHRAYRDGQRAYQRRNIEESLSLFRGAESALSRANSPFAIAATQALAGSYFNKNDYGKTLETLDLVQHHEQPHVSRHPALAARMLWLRGLTQHLRGLPDEALAAFQQSLQLFERLRETDNEAAIHALLAEVLDYLGEREEAGKHRARVFAIIAGNSKSPWLAHAAGSAAQAAMKEGLPHVALLYLDFEAETAKRLQNEPMLEVALHTRSLAHDRLGNSLDALRDLGKAREAAMRNPDPAIRQRALAELGITEARLSRSAKAEENLRNLTSSLKFFERTDNHFAIARISLERGLLHKISGKNHEAETDFARGITELESVRGRLPADDLRISYFTDGQLLFEELISLLASEGRFIEALDFSERARARALLDSVVRRDRPAEQDPPAARRRTPLSAESIAREIPERIVVVEYLVLEDRLMIWILRRNDISFYQVPISRRALEASVDDLVGDLRSSPKRRQRRAETAGLFSLLISPIEKLLSGMRAVIFVPDKCLYAVPFAALQRPGESHYLIERYDVAVAPSASLFLLSAKRDREFVGGTVPTALAVGNPKLDPARVGRLGDLPLADEEASRVAGLFPGSDILKGSQATKARFLALAPKHEIIHFAGHSVLNAARPQFSSLVLAPDVASSDAGILYAHEVLGVRLPKSRVVFASACQTAAGAVTPGEGAMSIARSFLASGVPTVIATLWPVSDAATLQLASDFYVGIRRGDNPLSALRLAQLAALHSSNSSARLPISWASFEVIGGSFVPH